MMGGAIFKYHLTAAATMNIHNMEANETMPKRMPAVLSTADTTEIDAAMQVNHQKDSRNGSVSTDPRLEDIFFSTFTAGI